MNKTGWISRFNAKHWIWLGIGLMIILVWLWPRGPTPEALVERAIAGEIVHAVPELKNNHAALLREAERRLPDLGPRDWSERKGLARLVAGVRFWQVVNTIDDPTHFSVNRALLNPDPEIVVVLSKLWLEGDQNDYAALLGLIPTGLLDFRTVEALARSVWDQSGPQGRVALTLFLDHLMTIALDSRPAPPPVPQGEVFALQGWDGYPKEERERMQAQMKALLNEWVVPTLWAAANGEGIPSEDAGAVRYMLRGLGVNAEQI